MKGLVVAHSSSCGALQVPSDGRQARARVASDRPLRTEYIPDLGSADHSSFPGIIPPSLSLSIAIAIPKTVRSRASSPAPHDVVYRDQAIPQFHSIPNAQPHPRHLNTSRSPVAYSHAQPQAQSQPYANGRTRHRPRLPAPRSRVRGTTVIRPARTGSTEGGRGERGPRRK